MQIQPIDGVANISMISKAGKATTASSLILSQWEKPQDGSADYVPSSKRDSNPNPEDFRRLKEMLDKNRPTKKKEVVTDAEKEQQRIKEGIENAMDKIKQRAAFMSLPLAVRMKKQRLEQATGNGKKIDLDRLEREIADKLKGQSGAAFKTLSREAWEKQNSIKAQAPPLGAYSARFTAVDARSDPTIPFTKQLKQGQFGGGDPNAGRIRKHKLAMRKMSICPQAVRILDNFVAQKRTVTNVKRPATTLDEKRSVRSSVGPASLQGSPEPRMAPKALGESPSPAKSMTTATYFRPRTEAAQRRDILRGRIPQNNSPIKLKAYETESLPQETFHSTRKGVKTAGTGTRGKKLRSVKPYAYDSIYQNQQYHIVHDRTGLSEMSVLLNDQAVPEPYVREKAEFRTKAFETYQTHQPINAGTLRSKTPNPRRFETVRPPKSKGVKSFSIRSGTQGHNVTESLLGRSFYKEHKDNETYVDCKPDAVKRRMDLRILKYKHMSPRKIGEGANVYTGFYKKAQSVAGNASAHPWKVHEANLTVLGHSKRGDVGVVFGQQAARDPTARYLSCVGQIAENIHLENTREARARDIAAARMVRRNSVAHKQAGAGLDTIGSVYDYSSGAGMTGTRFNQRRATTTAGGKRGDYRSLSSKPQRPTYA